MFRLGFLFLLLCAIWEYLGHEINTGIAVAGFFIPSIISLALTLPFIVDAVVYDMEEKHNKYSKLELQTIDNFNLRKFNDYLSENFKDCDGFYRKKEFYFLKDFMCYYFRIIDFTSLTGDINREENSYERLEEKSRSIALTIILKKDIVSEKELQKLKDEGMANYLVEKALAHGDFTNTIPVIYEASTQKLYFFYVKKKFDFSVYGHGCKKLIKIAEKIK